MEEGTSLKEGNTSYETQKIEKEEINLINEKDVIENEMERNEKEEIEERKKRNIILMEEEQVCNMNGFLWKRGAVHKSWKRRFFWLQDYNRLHYAKDKGKDSINYILLEELTEVQQYKGKNIAKDFCFTLNCSYTERVYFLAADSEEEMKLWLGVLGRLVNRSKTRYTHQKSFIEAKLFKNPLSETAKRLREVRILDVLIARATLPSSVVAAGVRLVLGEQQGKTWQWKRKKKRSMSSRTLLRSSHSPAQRSHTHVDSGITQQSETSKECFPLDNKNKTTSRNSSLRRMSKSSIGKSGDFSFSRDMKGIKKKNGKEKMEDQNISWASKYSSELGTGFTFTEIGSKEDWSKGSGTLLRVYIDAILPSKYKSSPSSLVSSSSSSILSPRSPLTARKRINVVYKATILLDSLELGQKTERRLILKQHIPKETSANEEEEEEERKIGSEIKEGDDDEEVSILLIVQKTVGSNEDALLGAYGLPCHQLPLRLDTGDLLLSNSRRLPSLGTKLFTRSQWDHIAMVVRYWDNSLRILEATNDAGVGVYLLEPRLCFLRKNTKLGVRRLRDTTRTPSMLDALYKLIDETNGRPFQKDFMPFVRAVVAAENQPDLSSVFCSELAAEALKRMDLIIDDKASKNFLPSHFADKDNSSLSFKKGFSLHRKLIFPRDTGGMNSSSS